MQRGKLIIFSAPSGSGKTTIITHLMKLSLDLEFSISATSREPRGAEVNGEDYHFLSSEEFKSKVDDNQFLEWEEVYKGTCYGTLKSEVERIQDQGKNVIFDVDVVGGCNIKEYYGSEALSIFVQPPSIKELESRLRGRSTDSEEAIERRIAKAAEELTYSSKFDTIVINDKLEDALIESERVIKEFIKK